MHTFYNPNNTNILPPEESWHGVKVMRLKSGDRAYVLDGKGNRYLIEITNAHMKKCEYSVIEKETKVESQASIHIAIAPTKNMDRMEWFVEKATEIGVSTISFVLCQNSERKVLKMERLHKIAVSAMKQSGRFTLPQLNELNSIKQFISGCTDELKLIAHLRGETLFIGKRIDTKKNTCLLIGPEGDFSVEEVDLAIEAGFKAISLGENVLRTETAGVTACYTLKNF